jgi:hypothetical protein
MSKGTENDDLLKAISSLGGGKSRPSLMQGLNLIGQQYLAPQTNIPSTFGNFYVGSPTAVMSDFAPLPLDWIEQDLATKQAGINQAETLAALAPQLGAFAAAPFRDEVKRQINQEYRLSELPQEWSKLLMSNPQAAQKVIQEYAGLQAKMAADPRLSKLAEEFNKFSKMTNEDFKTGHSNVFNQDTQSWKQLPIEQAPIYVADEAEEYIKKYYTPNLAATVTEVAAKNGMINPVVDAAGNLQYYNPGTKRTESVSLWDPKNPYTPAAVQFLSEKLRNDPNPQRRYILAEKRGLGDDPQKYYNYMLQTLSSQMYQKNTIEGDNLIIKDPPSGPVNQGPSPASSSSNIIQTPTVGADSGGYVSSAVSQSILNNREALQGYQSEYNNAVTQGLQDPIVAQSFDYFFKGGNGQFTNRWKKFTDKVNTGNPEGDALIKSYNPHQMLQEFFSNDKKYITEKYKMSEDFYKELKNDIEAGMLEMMSVGDDDTQYFLDDLFSKMNNINQVQRELDAAEALNNSINNQVINKSTELQSLKKQYPKEFDKVLELYNKYGSDIIDDASTYSGGPIGTERLKETTYAAIKELTDNGFLEYDKFGKGFRTIGAFTDFRKAFGKKFKEMEEKTEFRVDRKLLKVIGKEPKDYMTHNLVSGTITESDIMGSITTSDGKNVYNQNDVLSIAKAINPKFGDKIEKMEGKLGYNELTNGLVALYTVTSDEGKQVTIEGKPPGSQRDTLEVARELLQEPDEEDRALGKMILVRAAMDEKHSSKVISFFNPDIKLSNNLNIDVTVGNNQFRLKTVQAPGLKDPVKTIVRLVNGQEVPVTYVGKDAKGNTINANKINSPAHAFQIMGDSILTGINPTLGGQGGSSQGGKPNSGARITYK